jgi:hypothetical protein
MKKNIVFILLAILSISSYGQTFWLKHPENPILVSGTESDWYDNLSTIGSVIYLDSMYHMWYNAGERTSVGIKVGHATSPDGITWISDPNIPVFSTGSEGSWDQNMAECGGVTLVNDTLHMWYTGHAGSWSNAGIGHATSTDGVNWRRDTTNPVLSIEQEGDWVYDWIWVDEALFDGTKYHIWYSAGNSTLSDGSIGHASSLDGSVWTRDASNPVLKPGISADWDYPHAGFSSVVYDGTSFQMWYAGGDYSDKYIYEIGYAISADGSTWTKYDENPVLRKGPAGSVDASSVYQCNVIDSAGVKYKMWYYGLLSGTIRGFHYAESDSRVPYLTVFNSKPVYDSSDTLVAEIVLNGTIFIVPKGTRLNVDSINKSMVASVDAEAKTAVEIPLTDLSVGNFVVLGVSITGFISTKPYLLELVPDASPPSLFLEKDTVARGDPIAVSSSKDGTIFLVNEGAKGDPAWIRKMPFILIDSSVVQADIPVEFPTDGLNTDNYWLYAADIYGFISGPDSVTITASPSGIVESDAAGLRVYPNPSNTSITVETGKGGPYSIELKSINGQFVYTKKMEGPRQQIDLSSLQKGVYFITIRSRDFVSTKKIMKL